MEKPPGLLGVLCPFCEDCMKKLPLRGEGQKQRVMKAGVTCSRQCLGYLCLVMQGPTSVHHSDGNYPLMEILLASSSEINSEWQMKLCVVGDVGVWKLVKINKHCGRGAERQSCAFIVYFPLENTCPWRHPRFAVCCTEAKNQKPCIFFFLFFLFIGEGNN